MYEAKEGVKIAGRTLNNLRYADDTTLMAGKSGSDKTDQKAKERKRKGGPRFQHKEDKDYDNSQLGQL